MSEVNELLARAVDAAAAGTPGVASVDEYAALLKHGLDARVHVWDTFYADGKGRVQLNDKLAESSPSFQIAVAATKRALAEQLEDAAARRERVRAENPSLFKDWN